MTPPRFNIATASSIRSGSGFSGLILMIMGMANGEWLRAKG